MRSMYPDLFWLRQRFDGPVVADPAARTTEALATLALDGRVRAGQSVAVGVGSRGIANLSLEESDDKKKRKKKVKEIKVVKLEDGVIAEYEEILAMIDNFDGGPVGVESLAAAISEDRGTIEDVLEPYLIQQGFLVRTARGRMVTPKAWRHLGLKPKVAGDDLFNEG